MQFPINESKNPVCMEMRTMRSSRGEYYLNGAQEIGSIGSSDTYASCNTQPFNSQIDLTEDTVFDPLLDNSNVYINPLQMQCQNTTNKAAFSSCALRSLGASPLEESYKGFGVVDRGSRGSLNDAITTKNWRTRFQKVGSCWTNGQVWDKEKRINEFLISCRRWISTIILDWLSIRIREEGSHLFREDRWLTRLELLINICSVFLHCLRLVRIQNWMIFFSRKPREGNYSRILSFIRFSNRVKTF